MSAAHEPQPARTAPAGRFGRKGARRSRYSIAAGTAFVAIALGTAVLVWPSLRAPAYSDIVVAADTGAGDWFGSSVAVSGERLAVGAFYAGDAPERTGAVYAGERDGERRGELVRLVAPHALANDQAGFSVALDGDWLAVGAVGAFAEDPPSRSEGFVDVYRHDGERWVHHATLAPADGEPADRHGFSLALDAGVLAVGARGEHAQAGAVYLYRLDQPSLGPLRLQAPAPEPGDRFGEDVALDGTTLLVGAPGRDPGVTDGGAVFVFEASDDAWQAEPASLPPLVPPGALADARFGVGVDLSGDTAIVGASHWAPQGPGGSVWLATRREDGSWEAPVRIAADEAEGDMCGFRVTIDGDRAAASVHLADARGTDSGAVLLFERTGDGWRRSARLVPPDGDRGDAYGIALALDGDTLVVGAEQADAAGRESGGIYLLDLSAPPAP